MSKSKLLLLTVIASITFVSCKKESLITNPVMPSTSDARVKTKTEGNNVETYYYDSQNRLSKIVYSSGTSSYYHEYTYSAGAVTEYRSEEPKYEQQQTLANGAVKLNCSSNPSILKLNGNGYYIGASSYCQSQAYKYDANGFVINQDLSMTDYSDNEKLSNDSKNITSISCTGYNYGGGAFVSSTTYEYYTDKVNTIGNKNFGKSYLGKSSENLVKSETKNDKTITYSYVFDAQQRVIQKTTKEMNMETRTFYSYY